MSDNWIVEIQDLQQRRKAVSSLLATVQCGLCERDEREIEEHIGALAKALFDEDAQVRTGSFEAIHSALTDRQEVGPAYPAMLRILSDESHDLRVQASRFLADAAVYQESIEATIPALRSLVGDADRAVKHHAIRALALVFLHRREWDELQGLVKHPDSVVREQTLRALDPTHAVRHLYYELVPILPVMAARLSDRVKAVRLAAALVVVRVDRKGEHFPTTSRILVENLGHRQADIRKEAAVALKEAVDHFLAAHHRPSRRQAYPLLRTLATSLQGKLSDEKEIRWPCIDALVRILLATRQFDLLDELLESMESADGAVLLTTLGSRTNPHGDTAHACLGPSGLPWTALDPLVGSLERAASRREKAIREAATRTLGQVHIHTGRWEAYTDLFRRAPIETRCRLLDDLFHCQSMSCGRIDALVPMLLDYVNHPHEKLAKGALRRIQNYTAPGAYMLPWRGDLGYSEQARRAQVVLDAVAASGLSLEEPVWDLVKRTRSILCAQELARLARKLEDLPAHARLEGFLQALTHDNSAVCAWAAHEIGVLALVGEVDISGAIPAVRRSLHHDDMFVRAEAAEALGQAAARGVSNEGAIGDLVVGLASDPIDPVRAVMARALGMTAEKGVCLDRTVPALVRGLSDDNATIRDRCVSGLLGAAYSEERARIILDAMEGLAIQDTDEVVKVRKRCEYRLK